MRMDKKQDRFWKILEPEYTGAMMFCRKLMADRDKGDDLYQDTLIIAYTKFDKLRDESSFRPWLYRIIMNTFKSKSRLKFPKLFRSSSQVQDLNIVGKDPTDQYTAKRWLQSAFDYLTQKERALIVLYELEQWNIKELADLFEKSEVSIKQRLFRIRNKMKILLVDNMKKRDANLVNNYDNKKETPCAVVKPDSD